MFKKAVKTITKEIMSDAKSVVSETTENNREKIVETVVAGTLVVGAMALAITLTGKMIPSRTNLHVYIHLK